jgi:hypothetical protein
MSSPEPAGAGRWRSMVTVAVAMALGLMAVAVTLRFPQADPDQQPPVMSSVWGACWLIPGAVVVWHRPRELMGNLMLGFGLLLAVTSVAQVIQLHLDLAPTQGSQAELFQRVSVSLYVLLGLGIGLLVHLFPTGRPPSTWWRWPVGLLLVCGATLVVSLLLGVDGPDSSSLAVKMVAGLLDIGYALGLLSAIPSLGYRVWRARGVEREQVKWFLLAVVLATLGWFVNQIPMALRILFIVALPPLAIAVALLRYRLYDIDRIISRTASYAVVTGVLLATYAVVVTSVTRLLPDSSTLAVASATLAAAAIARPIYRRVKAGIDRRFNRARYDAEASADRFATSLRDQVDPDQVEALLLATVSRTLQPDTVRLRLTVTR